MASLTPAEITNIAEPLELVYQRMTDELMVNIANHFKGENWANTRIWELQKLGELGGLTEESIKIIARNSGRSRMEIRNAFLEAARISTLDLEPQFKEAAQMGILRDPKTSVMTSPAMQEALQSYVDQATDALNLTNQTMLESTRAVYVRAVETAANTARLDEAKQILETQAGEVITGQETRVRAIHKAVDQIVEQGITGFYDRAGRQWSPEAYVSMVIKTTAHNAAITAIRTRQQEYGGGDVFQISSHPGARPLCFPYQGGFYSWSGEGVFTDGDGNPHRYENIITTSYGEAAGIFGINCGHHPIPMIDGYSYPQEQEEITPEENARIYEESQKQRALERDIREAKRNVEMYKAAGDDAGAKAASAKLRHEQARMRQFIDETGRVRRYDRERIAGGGGKYVAPPTTRPATPVAPTPTKPVTTGYGKAVDTLDARHRTRVAELLDRAHEAVRNTWHKVQDKLDPPQFDADPAKGDAYFSPSDARTHFVSKATAFDRSSYEAAYQAYFHEYGHNIDYWLNPGYIPSDGISTLYKNGIFGKTLYEECGRRVREFFFSLNPGQTAYDLVKAAQDSSTGMGMKSYVKQALKQVLPSGEYRALRAELASAPESRFRELFDTYLKDTPAIQNEINTLISKPSVGEAFADYVKTRYNRYQRGDISDMFERYFVEHYDTEYPFNFGHGRDYALRQRSLPKEAFAEMFAATATQNEALEVIQEYFPESYQIFLEMLSQ